MKMELSNTNKKTKKTTLCNSLNKSNEKWKDEKPLYHSTTYFFQNIWSNVFSGFVEKNNKINPKISNLKELRNDLKDKCRKDYADIYEKDNLKFNSYLLCVDKNKIIESIIEETDTKIFLLHV